MAMTDAEKRGHQQGYELALEQFDAGLTFQQAEVKMRNRLDKLIALRRELSEMQAGFLRGWYEGADSMGTADCIELSKFPGETWMPQRRV